MSQYDANAGGMSDFGHDGPRPSNVLGIVGFILAFCTGPIGLIISLIALAKAPRGFAIGGVVVGLITTVLFAFLGFLLWAGGSAFAMSAQTATQYQALGAQIDIYKSNNNDMLPPDLAALSLPAETRTDYWGTDWRLEASADGSTYTLISAGPDMSFGTGDDIRFPEGLTEEELVAELQDIVQGMMEERFGGGSGGEPAAAAERHPRLRTRRPMLPPKRPRPTPMAVSLWMAASNFPRHLLRRVCP